MEVLFLGNGVGGLGVLGLYLPFPVGLKVHEGEDEFYVTVTCIKVELILSRFNLMS